MALEAQLTVEKYCANAAGDDVTLAANSVVAVGAVWAAVSAEADAGTESYLLYWRGVLGACLKQSEKAEDDLERFIAEASSDEGLAALVKDATRRLRRLQRGERRPAKGIGATTTKRFATSAPSSVPPESVVLLGAGGAMTAIGFGLAAGSYVEGNQLLPSLNTTEASYYANIDAYRQKWTAERVGVAIGATGAAMLTAGLVRLLVDRATAKKMTKAKLKRGGQ